MDLCGNITEDFEEDIGEINMTEDLEELLEVELAYLQDNINGTITENYYD